MKVADEIRLDSSAHNDHDMLIMLSYVFFAITFLVLVYAAPSSPGVASSAVAAMTAFP